MPAYYDPFVERLQRLHSRLADLERAIMHHKDSVHFVAGSTSDNGHGGRDEDKRHANGDLRENGDRRDESISSLWFGCIASLDGETTHYVGPQYEAVSDRPCDMLFDARSAWTQHIHAEDLPRLRDTIWADTGPPHFDERYRILRPDGSIRRVRERGFRVATATDSRLVSIVEDVTHAHAAEEATARPEDRHGDRAAMSDLPRACLVETATRLAEDLTQPLAAIANYAQAVGRLLDQEDDVPLDRCFDLLVKITEQTMRAGTMIRSFAAFVRTLHR
jgi:PAS domain-containing protein